MQVLYLALGAIALVGIAAFATYLSIRISVIGAAVFALVALWTGQFFLRDEPSILNPLLEAVFWALVVTVFIGVVGGSLGRFAREHFDEAWEKTRLDQLLIGRSTKTSLSWIVGGIFSFVVTFLLLGRPISQQILSSVPGSSLTLFLLGVLLIGVPIVYQTATNEGLLASWALSFGVPYAFFLKAFLSSSGEPPLRDMVYAGVIAIGIAMILGTFWFVIGLGIRRIAGSEKRPPVEENKTV